jgi:hypothetical protein
MKTRQQSIRIMTVLAFGASLGCGADNSSFPNSAGQSGVDASGSDDTGLGYADGSPGPSGAHPMDASAATDAGLPTGTGPNDGATTTATGPQGDSGSAIDSGTPTGPGGGTIWLPSSATPIHFHWQLSTTFSNPSHVIPGQGPVVYDIDGENNSAATVASLHALGPNVKVVCYVDVGTYEPGRSDASQFPASVLGSGVSGWPGERWLDVRQQSILMPIMTSRIVNWCQKKGFDGLEPDNMDQWANSPGFPMTEADSVSYDLAIASVGHSLGLSVGVKNLLPAISAQNVPRVQSGFDWVLSEQCFEYSECNVYQQTFAMNGKAAWDVEYSTMPNCTQANAAHQNAQQRELNLGAPGTSGYVYQPCIPDSQTTW